METWLDITTPTTINTHVDWPEGVPYPSIGDRVLFRKNEHTWGFQVLTRLIGIGMNPRTGLPGAHVSVGVDTEPPPGYWL